MAEKELSSSSTAAFRKVFNDEGKYSFKSDYEFSTSRCCDKTEYERRVTCNGNLNDIQVQILRYLAHYTYADVSILVRAAHLDRKRNPEMPLLDPGTIKDEAEKLVRNGSICRCSYMIKRENMLDDGRFMDSKAKMQCYCLSANGTLAFRHKSDYGGYIEELLPIMHAGEIIKRLQTNICCSVLASDFSGTYTPCESTRLEKDTRRPLYGMFRTSHDTAIFEPVLWKRDIHCQQGEEVDKHIVTRAKFIHDFIAADKEKEENKDRKYFIVFVIEKLEDVKRTYNAYEDQFTEGLSELVEDVYVTNEAVIDYALSHKRDTVAPFIKLVKKPDSFKIMAETPEFFLS